MARRSQIIITIKAETGTTREEDIEETILLCKRIERDYKVVANAIIQRFVDGKLEETIYPAVW